MTQEIEAILFDMGGTLRGSVPKDETTRIEIVGKIVEVLGADVSAEEMNLLLTQHAKAYGRWARKMLAELNEQDLWTQWMLPDWPSEQIGPLAVTLNQLWRDAIGTREIFPQTRATVLELFRRGYRLGLVSNTTSSVETPKALKEMRLSGLFETVILSCQVGKRKPDPAILLEATQRMGIAPQRCAYIGDRLNRDVIAAQQAGFAQSIILRDPQDFAAHQEKHPELAADHYIDSLTELLEIFPARAEKARPSVQYNASLSTMWAMRNFPSLPDFCEAARRLGFANVELNHQVNSAMLEPAGLNGYRFSSIHEPCPADVSTDQLKERDWLISSPDEERRVKGVESIRQSIDLARHLGAPVIVVHSGMVSTDLTLEKKMRALLVAGQAESDEYRRIKQELVERRRGLIAPRLASVKKSLAELLDYAAPDNICLGLENRYHYFDIPTPDEMEELLSMAGPEQLGFVYDVGHAQALDRLGFFHREEWLKRFADRIVETHLHDVIGVSDHLAPGLGEVDYDRIAAFLPAGAIRTFEVQPSNTPEQVKSSLQFLAEHGCIQTIQ